MAVIGLSFGNTSSSIAYTKDNKVEVIANPDGDRAIPSMLSYAHGDEYHGLQAKQQLIRNASNTIGWFRDFVGHKFADIDASCVGLASPPKALEDGSVGFEVDGETIPVAEIVCRHFGKLAHAATDYIGREIEGAILALPASASDEQKNLIVEAATKAGIQVLDVIHESAAALLAHETRSDLGQIDKIVAVIDIGGSRSDGTIFAVNGGIETVLGTTTKLGLGGRSLDDKLIAYLASEFEKETSSKPSGPRAAAKLSAEAEAIKKTLSNSTSTQFGIESLSDGADFSGSLTRLKLELIGREYFSQIAEFVRETLATASLDPLDVDEVLLVGGATWTPKVATVIGSVFADNTKVQVRSPATDTRAVDPDELIARGAAIQAALTSGLDLDAEEIAVLEKDEIIRGPHLAKAVGLVGADGSILTILKEHTLVPIRKTLTLDASGPVLLKFVEINREIVTETHKPEPAQKTEDDDESDWSEDDEEYETKSVVLKPGKLLAEIALTAQGKVDIVVDVLKGAKLQLSARSGDEVVSGRV